MKVLLIQPPHYYDKKSRKPHFFPLGLGYIAKTLLNSRYEVEVFDIFAHQYNNEEVKDKISKINYDIVGISALSTQYSYVKWLASELKKYNDVPIVLGNALATFSSEIVLKHTDIDICCIGEGEITFIEIVENLKNLKLVKGIHYKQGNEILKNPPRQYINNLDNIDFPAWDLFPMHQYLKFGKVYGDFDLALNIITGRGCPYNCKFCSKTFNGVRLRSIDNIIQEIKFLKLKYGIKGIFINDELFITSKKRVFEFCDKIKPLNIKWNCQGRVNIVNVDLLRRMKEAGCVAVGYGIESGSQTILNNMNKLITTEQSEKAIKDTLKLGMYPIIQMMYGYPGENKKTLRETMDFFKKIPYAGKIGLSVTTPLPGSELYETSIKDLKISEEKYLLQLDSGYMGDGTQHLHFNKTQFRTSDEFFNYRLKVEKRIFYNQVINYPCHFLKYKMMVLFHILHHTPIFFSKYGFRELIRKGLKFLIH